MTTVSLEDSHPFQELLSDGNDIHKIYDALGKDDLSEAIVTTMNSLKQTATVEFKKDYKMEEVSDLYRNEGNKFYSAKRFRPALEYYNRALLYAPINSQAMKLAFSNRSALLFSVNVFSACINDIETVFSMGCTEHKLAQRLRLRKTEALQRIWIETRIVSLWEDTFFNFNVKRHPEIPCASKNVDVAIESGLPKIVAAKRISVGKVVAIENPFVSALHQDNYYISCHYCHQLFLNLIPCDGCCVALFCSEECRRECKKDYHDIECEIIHNHKAAPGPASIMALRAALKIKQLCKSWKELIDASKIVGEDRMRCSSIKENFDVKSKFSLLSHNNTSHFLHGEIFNQSFGFGIILRDLANLPSFFPNEAGERDAAIRALARIMMNLYTSYRKIEIINAAKDVSSGNFTTNIDLNSGWFSFAGKLKHSCDANLLIIGLKNKIALVAIRPIKKGDELTISFLSHYYENMSPFREYRLFCATQTICECRVCTEKWSPLNFRRLRLNTEQTKAFIAGIRNGEGKSAFKSVCDGLAGLDDAACTAEHHGLYKEFRKLTTFYQCFHTDNKFVKKGEGDDLIIKYNMLK
ncbi:SET domain-containing protein [Phthorimaea operculella]|nr:SET domain-containing protein [Phthorimaea operculella]